VWWLPGRLDPGRNLRGMSIRRSGTEVCHGTGQQRESPRWCPEELGHICAVGTDFERSSPEFDPGDPSSEMEYWMPITAKPED